MKGLANIVLVTMLLALTFSVNAETKIGLIDVDLALALNDDAKKYKAQVDKELKPKMLEIEALTESFKKMQIKLLNDSALMSFNEQNKLKNDIEQAQKELGTKQESLQRTLASKGMDARKTFGPKVDRAIKEVIKENKLDLVLNRKAALHIGREGLDYTQKVIDKINSMK